MKEFFKFLFKGSVNNQELIDNSKVHSLLSSILVLIISLIIAVVPNFVNTIKKNGSSILTETTNQSLQTGLVLFTDALDDSKNSDIVIENGLINIESISFDGKSEYAVTVPDRSDASKETTIFTVKVCSNTEATNYMNMYKQGKDALDGQASTSPRSYIIFTESNVYVGIFAANAVNVLNTDSEGNPVPDESGKYTIKTQASLAIEYAGTTSKITKKVSLKSFNDATSEDAKYDTTIKNWTSLLNDLYKPYKIRTTWITTGLFSAINLVTVLLVAVLLVVLTHLKHSTGEKLNLLSALKITCYGALAPAIVSLALGFFIATFSQIGFILCLGLRSTFLAMKASNPQTQQ